MKKKVKNKFPVRNTHGLTKKQIRFARKVMSDPVLFATHILGIDLWDREIDVLRSIQLRTRTAVKACHVVGKTLTLAIAVLWWLARYREGIVLTTSPTQRQVKTQVWVEIRRLVQQSKAPFPDIKTTEFKFRDDNNFAIGLSTNQAENFQGYHGKQVLIIADEAPGIASGVWDAIAGIMAGGMVHVVMAGNPTNPSGAFFDAFHGERGLWNCLTIGAFDTPNLEGLTLEQLLEMDPREGGPLDQNRIPYLVTRRWVYEQYFSWFHGDERSSPNWLSRVLARFPDQAMNALIRLHWLERAKARALTSTADASENAPLVAGVDVGGGEAETVVYVCEYKSGVRKIIAMAAWRGEDTRGEVVNFLNQFRARLSTVRVDAIGIGHTFGLHLRDCRFPVELINVSQPCESKPNLGECDPACRFVNLRAQFYQELADAFERDEIEGFTDETTFAQLASLIYEFDSHGKMKLESKQEARARGVRSPDRADALMLAFCKPHQKLELYSVRDFPPSEFMQLSASGRQLKGQAARDAMEDLKNTYRWRHRIGGLRSWDGY